MTEVMVTMIVTLIVLSSLYGIFDMGLRVFSFGNSEVEATENARLGLEKMKREVQQAYAYDRGSGVCTPIDPATDPCRILLTWTPTSITFGNDLNGNFKISGDEATEKISYSADNSEKLKRSVNGGAARPVVEYLDYVSATDTGLKFTYCKKAPEPDTVTGDNCPTGFDVATSESEIAIVRIELRISVVNGVADESTAPDQFQDGNQTLTTDVALRNRGEQT